MDVLSAGIPGAIPGATIPHSGGTPILILKCRVGEYLVLRDSAGVVANLLVVDSGHDWARIGVNAGDWIEINRHKVDQERHPNDYRKDGAK